MRNNSLSAPTPAELMAIEAQQEANKIERDKIDLDKCNAEILKKNATSAAIAAIAAVTAAIAGIANLIYAAIK